VGYRHKEAACCIKRDFAVVLDEGTGDSPMLAMVFSKVRYAPPIPGSLMRLKKLPIAVNMSVDVKEVNRPQTASIRKGLGWDSKDDAPNGK